MQGSQQATQKRFRGASSLWKFTRTTNSFNQPTPSTSSSSLPVPPRRLLKRDAPFRQSTGVFQVHQYAGDSSVWNLYRVDWFHVLLSQDTWKVFVACVALYTIVILIFAGFYMAADWQGTCGLGIQGAPMQFQAAFAFSMETATTVGYGLPGSGQSFFVGCKAVTFLIYVQMIVSIALNSLVVGLVLQRLGRADKRSHQVVFSDKACIRCVKGEFYFTFQVYDLGRRRPLVESHIRCYAITHTRGELKVQQHVMRLLDPDDELGGFLFLGVPSEVTHQIDNWSPLMPDHFKEQFFKTREDGYSHGDMNRQASPGLVLRAVDSSTGGRDTTSCPVCGETFPSDDHLFRHIRFAAREEEDDDADGTQDVIAEGGRHAGSADRPPTEEADSLHHLKSFAGDKSGRPRFHADIDIGSVQTTFSKSQPRVDELFNSKQRKLDHLDVAEMKTSMRDHLQSHFVEVIVVMEAIDPKTSNTFQARHSYTSEDIVFDHVFATCVTVSDKTGVHRVSLDSFHHILPSPGHQQ